MGKNYRIKDIAELSGVSTGTVDRILHGRGKVSEEARRKVDKVLKEIDYQPNLIARSLALKKKYHFITLTPSFVEGEYWEKLCQGIGKAQQELFSYNVEVKNLFFDQYDKTSFDRLIPVVEEAECQGVVIATLFKDSVLNLTARLDELQIPYVFIDAYIDKTKCIAFYGTHSFDSGYIAGRLLIEQTKGEGDIAVFRLIRRGDMCSTQVMLREEGFRHYLNMYDFRGRILPMHIYADDEQGNRHLLDSFFEEHSGVKFGVIFNSRAHLLGDYLEECPDAKALKLIGYDNIDANVHYLNSGLITYLIAQRPEVQGLNCIKALFRHLVLQEKIVSINFMPIDVLVKENIKYYNNYI